MPQDNHEIVQLSLSRQSSIEAMNQFPASKCMTPSSEHISPKSEFVRVFSWPQDDIIDLGDEAVFRRTGDSACGAYFVERSKCHGKRANPLAVFKPQNEEKATDAEEKAARDGIVLGDSVLKERAAYRLDHKGFAGVPQTHLVTIKSKNAFDGLPTFGSVQLFSANEGCAEDFGVSMLPADQVQRTAILDLRILNMDRHEGNLLVHTDPVTKTKRVTPIDHGYCLPSYRHLSQAYFAWSSWSQAAQPLTEAARSYVLSLDAASDAKLLASLGIRDESVITNLVCTIALQHCVRKGLTLKQIASLFESDNLLDSESKSALQRAVDAAESAFILHNASGDHAGCAPCPLWEDSACLGKFERVFLRALDQQIRQLP